VTAKNSRLVVALVTDSIYPYYRGGKETRYHELARRIAERADVTVYTMKWWEGATRHHDGPVAFRAICRLHDLYHDGRRSVRQSLVFAGATTRLLFRRFDVIEVDTVPYPQIFALKLVAVVRRRRLVVTWHEVWDTAQWNAQLGRLGYVGALLGRIAMLLPDEIIAVSPGTAEQLRGRVRRSTRVHLAPGGIDLAAIRAAPVGADAVDVLYIGRLIPHKGAGMLLEALALLRSGGTELTALIVGRGPQAGELREMCRRYGLDDVVRFREDVETGADVYSLMKAAAVVAAPSTREGFGVAVLEALACGVPVVTTSHPENMARLLIEESGAGQICAPDPPSLAAAILRAMSDDARVDEAWLRRYDWYAVAERVMEAYTR
jgi:glycosyltransferase involved in cell wall biosynthesis